MKGRQIGKLAQEFGVPVETIRYYERCGLLDEPARSEGNYRIYGESQVEQLRFIVNCRCLDMDQDEIRRLLKLRARPPKDCTQVNAIIDQHIAHIEVRLADLHELSRQLRELRQSCNQPRDLDNCRIIDALRTARTGKRAAPRRLSRHGRAGG